MMRWFVYICLFLLISSVVIPVLAEDHVSISNEVTSGSSDESDVYLLRVEHYLYLQASQDVGIFHVHFSFPPDYGYQAPIYLEIFNDSTLEKIIHYTIQDDVNPPNKIIVFTLKNMSAHEQLLLHFTCWVLVQNHDFSDLPDAVCFPRKKDLPVETRIWLSATPVVQVNSIILRDQARQLRKIYDDVLSFAERVSRFIKYHRYLLFVLQLNLGVFFSQDARTTLFINGENVGRSHLACALLRSQNIPARVILALNDQGFWTQMHYMVEYYVPTYGWVLLDTTKGMTPYETHRQVINRICYPADEQDTKTDYIFPRMNGEERWLWIDTLAVTPYYVDCDVGSKSQMFEEKMITADEFTAEYSVFLTRLVFHLYQQYLGMELTGDNLQYYTEAVGYHYQALHHFIDHDILGYIDLLNRAYDAYNQIQVI